MLVKILITEETENYKLTRESQGFKGRSVGGSNIFEDPLNGA